MANESIFESAIFKGALGKLDSLKEALSPAGSIAKGKEMMFKNLDKTIENNKKVNATLKEAAKNMKNNKVSDEMAKKLSDLGINAKNMSASDLTDALKSNIKELNFNSSRADYLKENGFRRGANISEDLQVIGGAAKDYYNPKGKNIKTIAARYGATAGVLGAGALIHHEMSDDE